MLAQVAKVIVIINSKIINAERFRFSLNSNSDVPSMLILFDRSASKIRFTPIARIA